VSSAEHAQNPPPKFAEAERKKDCLLELKQAQMLPSLKITELKAASAGDRLFKVTAVIENQGFLPTNVTQKAIQNRLAYWHAPMRRAHANPFLSKQSSGSKARQAEV